MAKLMSKKTREIVQTSAVIVVVILFIIFYIVIPLITVPDLIARPDKDKFEDPEFIQLNDPSQFISAGLHPDTFALVTRDNINLACLYFNIDTTQFDSSAGTVILIHDEDTNRTSMIPYIEPILGRGYNVIIFDQRACGLSGGIWHTAGRYESDDLVDLIAELNIHEQLHPPIIAIGFGLGADAAIRALSEENRFAGSILVSPYLTGEKWVDAAIERADAISIPLANMTYYWWFKKISGFPYDRTSTDNILPITKPTILLMPEDELESEETRRLAEITPEGVLKVKTLPDNLEALPEIIADYAVGLTGTTP